MGSLRLLGLLATLSLTTSSVVKSPSKNEGAFELLILHNNDMHARFEQTSQLSGACTTADRDAGKCYGGFPRVAHVVKEARAAAASGEGPPVLYLNAGDTYTGTAWFTIYKWKIAAEFINALQPDAVSLGNHEFDESVDGLIPFIRNISAPVLAANLILDKVPQLKAETNLKKSIVIIINRVSIGIIGYLTPHTRFLAPQTDVEYEDEVIAIKREVAILQDRGVKILIALGHSGFLEDLKIAKEVGGIDLVIGGHSNTFLSNDRYFTEKPEIQQGPYPTLVEQASGKIVPVVQAYAYTKYMGRLHVIFDSNGEIIEVDGEPILLNQSIPQDPEVDKLVKIYHEKMDYINNEVVGTSLDFLNGETCRLRECNIGSFITDATLKYSKENNICTNIAIIQGGRIRSSITRQVKPFQMTKGDWYTVLPFTDPLSIITMNGTLLRKALEHSVDTWRNVDSTGQFLQFSGMQVVYDLAKPPGSRIISAKAHGTIDKSSCEESPLVDIQDNMIYKVIMSSFLALGGDGYEIFQELPVEVQVFSEIVAIFDYIDKYGPLDPALTGRLTVLNEDEVQITKDNFLSSSISTEQILSYSSSVSIRSSVLVISFGILPFIVIS